MAALDSASTRVRVPVLLDGPQPEAGRPGSAFTRRLVCVLVTAAALAIAIALEVSGPTRPLEFSVRLPLLVLGIGGTWTARRWRSRPARAREPAPMATPALILTSTAGIAAITVKLLTTAPAYGNALFAVSAAVCCLMVGLCLTGGWRDDATRPDSL